MTGPAAAVLHVRGSAAELHARTVPDDGQLAVWWLDADRPAVVLGSTQADDVVDRSAAAALGVDVARRRSGGGAVLVDASCTWIDVVLPRGDARWDDDVTASFTWLGHAWAGVLAALGHEGVAVHHGPLERTAASALVCFGGLGPGEVTVGGRKVVGISQRRTRSHARFQCAVLHRWEPQRLVDLLALDPRHRAQLTGELLDAAVGLEQLRAPGPSPASLVAALAAAVSAR